MVSVEDEWERYPQSTENLDLLFVTYDPRKIGVEEMQKTIADLAEPKFKAVIRDDAKE